MIPKAVSLIAAAALSVCGAACGGEHYLEILRDGCVRCHGAEKQKGKFALHDIGTDIAGGDDVVRWEKILEMVSIGDMPPEDEEPLAEADREALVGWLEKELGAIGRGPAAGAHAFPEGGNRVDHEALFSGEHTGPAYTPSRLWRISPHIYSRFAVNVDMARKLTAPLRKASGEGKGFLDYSLLDADAATIQTMLQNAKRAATTLIRGRTITFRGDRGKGQKPGRSGSRHRAFAEFVEAEGEPGAEEMNALLDYVFRFFLSREPSEAERERYLDGFLVPNVALAGREEGLKGLLATVMLSPEFLFRMELGLGEELADGRRRLSGRELAFALSYAVFDYLDPTLLKAAEEGKLDTAEGVAAEFRRVLDSPDRKVRGPANKRFWVIGKGGGISVIKLMDASHPRLLRFFREYFGYTAAPSVFKDDTRHDGKYKPWNLVKDADWFVLRALKDDRQVLERLLTGDDYYVEFGSGKPKLSSAVYNIEGRVESGEVENPFAMPAGQRAGMLTHPAWLAAHSGNFENDPVRRGKWIRERLLAGVVPDIPIGVEAQLPEEPDRTLRQRFHIVEAEECWRCHKKMNPLGNPFEAFDDFGRFRESHVVDGKGHVIASEFEAYSRLRKVAWRDSHKKGHPPETFTTVPVDTSGELRGTGDSALDGEVNGPVDLLGRLARSERVRQCFVRHVFRYWTGRNETLDDSPTLMAMDRAYVENDGSFREMLVALVTSDSFLYRR